MWLAIDKNSTDAQQVIEWCLSIHIYQALTLFMRIPEKVVASYFHVGSILLQPIGKGTRFDLIIT